MVQVSRRLGVQRIIAGRRSCFYDEDPERRIGGGETSSENAAGSAT